MLALHLDSMPRPPRDTRAGTFHVFTHCVWAAPGLFRDDSHLQTVYKYVARNPVEAQLCSSCEDWPWSSYAAAIGLAEPNSFVDPMRVLASFDLVRESAAAQLRTFVEES